MVSNIGEFIALAEAESWIYELSLWCVGGLLFSFFGVWLSGRVKSYKAQRLLAIVSLLVIVFSIFGFCMLACVFMESDSGNLAVAQMDSVVALDTQIKAIISENESEEKQVEKICEYLDKEEVLGNILSYERYEEKFMVDFGKALQYKFVLTDNTDSENVTYNQHRGG